MLRSDVENQPQGGVDRSRIREKMWSLSTVVSGRSPNRFPSVGKSPSDYKIGASVPYSGLESYQRIIAGIEAAMIDFGGELTLMDANYSLEKQASQIAELVDDGVDALVVMAADIGQLAEQLRKIIQSGTPVVLTNIYVPDVSMAPISMHDGFRMGMASSHYIVNRLNGRGKIGLLTLPNNDNWALRSQGLKFELKQSPGIKVVCEWPFDSTLETTARDAVDQMLAEYPDLDAIWAAWDQGAIEAAEAIEAAGRSKMFCTGIDGGLQSFEHIRKGGSFVMTVALSLYAEAYFAVVCAHEALAGRKLPNVILNKGYMVTNEQLRGVDPQKAGDYDLVGGGEALGWTCID